jgi:predicted lipoprotein with Yx(FWY)xxD motif
VDKRIILAAAAMLLFTGCEGADQEIATNEAGNQATAADQPLPGGGAAKPLGAAIIQVASKEPYGQYLVDGAGLALYILMGPRQQGPQQQAADLCTGECLAEWPPVLSQGAPNAGQGADAGRIATVARPEGQQVSYAGWPLYYYKGDRLAGSTSGQAVEDRWGSWHLLSPQGQPIEGREMGPAAQ